MARPGRIAHSRRMSIATRLWSRVADPRQGPATPPVPRAAGSSGAPRRAFERAGLLDRIRPFAWVATVAVIAVAFAPPARIPAALAAGAALTGLAIAAAVALPWHRLPAWADVLPPLAYVGAIALLRHAGGGAESGLVPLFALPLVWSALYGSRAQLLVVLGAAGAVTILPIVLIGDPLYPFVEWRRAVLDTAVGTLVGLTVNGLVAAINGHVATERTRSAALAEQEARLRAVHESAHDAIVTLSPDGRIVDVNPAALEMFRATTRDQLVGQDLIASRAIEAEQAFLREGMVRLTTVQDEPVARRFKTELVRLDGEVFAAEVSVGIVVVDGGYLIHAFARDISERERSEAAARQHQDDLAGLLDVASEMSASASGPAVRTLICETALRLAHAATAVLVEPVGDDLVRSAFAGRSSTMDRVPRDGRSTLTATSFQLGEPIFSRRMIDDPRVTRLAESAGVSSGYWQPIRGASGVAGVLVVLWEDEVERLDPRTESLLNLLANQAAVALELGELVGTLEGLARTDGLTGIANRRAFDETLAAELAQLARSGAPLSLLLIDLDHFKRFNDTHGHQAGDRFLVDVATVWQRELRPSDSLARYGGEEFVVVLPNCSTDAALRVAARLRGAVPGRETVSVGVATHGPGETAAELIARADAALYRAKKGGRDRVVASDSEAAPAPD